MVKRNTQQLMYVTSEKDQRSRCARTIDRKDRNNDSSNAHLISIFRQQTHPKNVTPESVQTLLRGRDHNRPS